jgi:predicted dehydrogenase
VTDPVRVGLLGAGPWARFVHAPVLAAGPETTLAGIWARRSAAAADLAEVHRVPAFTSIDDLFAASDAIACCVPPDVQADLAIRAADAGKALLLEKPLGLDVAMARRVADAIRANGVGSIVLFTQRFAPSVRTFLADTRTIDVIGARGLFVSGALAGGPFADSPWRQAHGALLDVGPHICDLIEVAVGPVHAVAASGSVDGYVGVTLHHTPHRTDAPSVVSQIGISGVAAGDGRTEVEVFGRDRSVTLDGRDTFGPELFANLRRELAEVTRSPGPHPCDARRGLDVQRVIDAAGASLASGGDPVLVDRT